MPSIAILAERFVKEYLEDKGWTVKTSKDAKGKSKWIGYDLLAMKGNEIRFIEVKGTGEEFGIPDMPDTEFTRNLTLIATHLCIVGNLKKKNKKPVLYVIERNPLRRNRKYLRIKRTIHFSSTFQKRLPHEYKVPKVDF
jgi:hypothetical protein